MAKRWNQSRRVGDVLVTMRTHERGQLPEKGTFALARSPVRVLPNDASVQLSLYGDTFSVQLCVGLDDLATLIRTMRDASEIVAANVAEHAERVRKESDHA